MTDKSKSPLAQSLDVMLSDGPLWMKGDASAVSFHATKLLHTCEGGAVIAPGRAQQARLHRMCNFGLRDGQLAELRINGKMPELHAAIGFALLPDVDREMPARRAVRGWYDDAPRSIPNLHLHSFPELGSKSLLYYAIRIPSAMRSKAQQALLQRNIAARPGFPLLCGAGTAYPHAPIHSTARTAVAPQSGPDLMCLPLHSDVKRADVDRVADGLASVLARG